ncbi:hypothetical protein QQF64_022659 [Cirrhinus molitorella]|uniref:Uncharacterized protein n=1 Tax=Cirrhinus molitorella TaxID=172907 RepID=A0ABR3L360_9TELE
MRQRLGGRSACGEADEGKGPALQEQVLITLDQGAPTLPLKAFDLQRALHVTKKPKQIWFSFCIRFLAEVAVGVKTIDYGLKGTLILPLCPACLTPSNSNCTSLLVHISLFFSPSLYFFHTRALSLSLCGNPSDIFLASYLLLPVGFAWSPARICSKKESDPKETLGLGVRMDLIILVDASCL